MAYEYKDFSEFKVGDKSELSKTITEEDIIKFADLTGDHNPMHLDEEHAKKTMFGGRIAHGLLVTSYLGAVGAPFFGSGAIYVGHSQSFLAPTRIGDTVTAIVEVKELKPEKRIVVMRGYVKNQKDEIVVDGEMLVKIVKKRD